MIQSVPPPYEVRCPLHGSIPFNERERAIIDHPYYQRLRFISQLGFSSLVYPGATHNRFSHGLGVMHLAGRIFDQIISNSPEILSRLEAVGALAYCRQIIRFAGLLHDIGHPPFSHSFEPLLPRRGGLPLPADWYGHLEPEGQASHEDYSVALVHALASEPGGPLSMEEARDIGGLIHDAVLPSPGLSDLGGGAALNIFPLMKQIISGEIDADRMDYLRRDAYFAGVAYGYFDQDRLVSALSCVSTLGGLVMALEHNALYTYENFLMTRFHMAMQVYLHKTVLVFEHFLHRAVESGEIECRLERDLEQFLGAREDTIMARLHAAREHCWASRIVNRRPFSRLVRLGEDTSHGERERMLKALADAGIETVHIREERRLSSLGTGQEGDGYAIQVREEHLGRPGLRPLHEVSVLLERYNQIFVIENIYCSPRDYQRGIEVLRALAD